MYNVARLIGGVNVKQGSSSIDTWFAYSYVTMHAHTKWAEFIHWWYIKTITTELFIVFEQTKVVCRGERVNCYSIFLRLRKFTDLKPRSCTGYPKSHGCSKANMWIVTLGQQGDHTWTLVWCSVMIKQCSWKHFYRSFIDVLKTFTFWNIFYYWQLASIICWCYSLTFNHSLCMEIWTWHTCVWYQN